MSKTLNHHAPAKQKFVRGNHLPFMNKTLSKAIMHRTRFCKKYLWNKTDENKRKYTKQQNYCVSLLRKSKKEYYSNLDVKNITDNKTFWKTVKPFLSDKVISTEKITLIENDTIVKIDNDTIRALNTFFSNIVRDLKIPDYKNCDPMAENIQELVIKEIVKYRNHPRILTIGELCKKIPQFSLRCVDKDEILKEILNFNASKVCRDSDIPSRIIKENADIFTGILHSSFSNSIYQCEFSSILKLANITPVFKERDRNFIDHRPVSILSNISKIFEWCMFRQISSFMDSYLSKQQCGFRKGYSPQYCLLVMLKKWKNAIDMGKCFKALLTDLSKALDCIFHELLIVKLLAYGSDFPALKRIQSYLSNRKQRTKINATYISLEEILFEVPQGSILGPLLLNIFLCDLFWIMCDTDFANYADDNTSYALGDSIDDIIKSLKNDSINFFKWFLDNQMKANSDKCQLITRK